MSRTFTPTSIFDLRRAIDAELGDLSKRTIIKKFGKDIKVSFDFENFSKDGKDFGPSGLMGYRTLTNGLTFLGLAAGGDWEHPVFFIIYMDGKKLRAYVPTDGNPWNTSTKKAYGNDEKADLGNAKKRWPQKFKNVDAEDLEPGDFDFVSTLIEEDIVRHFNMRPAGKPNKKASLQDRIESLVYYGTGDEAYELFREMCRFCYMLVGLGISEKAATVCEWAEEFAAGSADDEFADKSDFAKGVWGY